MILILPILLFVAGLIFIIFNKKLVRLKAKLESKKLKTIDENSTKTQFYIIGGLLILDGFIVLTLTYKSLAND